MTSAAKKRRQELRTIVFELADNQCEHPHHVDMWGSAGLYSRCPWPAIELAHIFPRGMGHTGYRDTLGNVMAACRLHARSTDDLSSAEWLHVPAPHDRKALQDWVKSDRERRGYPTIEDWHPA